MRALATRFSSIRLFVVAVLLAFALSASAEVKVFKGFTLIDGTGAVARANQAMILTDGRITWLGPAEQLKAPAGAQVVDLSGKFVIPGLIDSHVHLGAVVGITQNAANETVQSVEHDLRTFASYGVTTVQSMGTDKDFVLNMRDEQRASGRPHESRIFSAGQGFIYQGGTFGLAGVNPAIADPDQARKAVDLQASHHVDLVKMWVDTQLGRFPRMPYPVALAVVDEAHKDGTRAVAHIFYLQDAQTLADGGINGFAHIVRDQVVTPALIKSMKQHGTWQVAATLTRDASMFIYGKGAPLLDDPFLTHSITPETVKALKDPKYVQTMQSDPHFEDYQRYLAQAEVNLKKLADAGIPYGCGTDSGPPGRFAGYFLHWEMELMVEAGLTPMQVIQACTQHNAEFLHANDLGTIENGKWGDFVVLQKNPMDNILNTRTIDAVYIGGNRFQ
jgi:imidazolonepropionase-like amidohydrolase